MAGSLVPQPMQSVQQNQQENSVIAIGNQWEVQYSRFFTSPSSVSSLSSTHPSLIPRKLNHSQGIWISSSSFTASLKLLLSTSDSLLTVSLRQKLLEEHHISKLHFSWPQASCMSGFPGRGSRVVFASYRNCAGQTQKFALRFLTNYEAENFMNALKENLENLKTTRLPCGESGSEMSSQSEFFPSNGNLYRVRDDWSLISSNGSGALQLLPNFNHEFTQNSNSLENELDNANDQLPSAFPPSFTSMLMKCGPLGEQAQSPLSDKVDLKIQITRYLEDASFQEMLIKVEKIIGELGDHMFL